MTLASFLHQFQYTKVKSKPIQVWPPIGIDQLVRVPLSFILQSGLNHPVLVRNTRFSIYDLEEHANMSTFSLPPPAFRE